MCVRVLLVDDEPAVLRAVKKLLVDTGHAVVEFDNSVDALAAFRAEPERFDLGVFDYRMPELDGAGLAREVRTVRADFPILLVTGHAIDTSIGHASAIGVTHILNKPFTWAELREAIRNSLSATR